MPHREAQLLLVDDDPSTILAMSRMLAQYPRQRFATSGEEALRLARETRPDLILIDADMPGMSGLEVCGALQADAELARVPVIFATSHDGPQVEAVALSSGACDFVAKPFTASQLSMRVRARLRTIKPARPETPSDHPFGDAPERKPRLLILGEDLHAAWQLSRTLGSQGDFVLAKSLDDAHRLAGEGPIDVILLADHGSNAEALATCAQVKADRTLGRLPLMFMSFVAGHRHELKAFDLGATDFVAMPCDTAVLQARVRNLLEYQVRPELEAANAPTAEAPVPTDAGPSPSSLPIGTAAPSSASASVSGGTASARARSLLLSSVAHEIGNPLSIALGFAQLMATDEAHPLPREQARRLEQIVAGCRHIESLVKDLTDFGALEAGRLTVDRRSLCVAASVERATSAISLLAAQSEVAISVRTVSNAVRALGDADRLHQCLVNLLTNAVKYNRPDGNVHVEVRCHARTIDILVRDNGLGMDESQLQQLFEPFNRLGRQRAAARGTGLGLVVTRQLVQAMGGELKVESAPGEGSTFTIVLPRTATQNSGTPTGRSDTNTTDTHTTDD